MVIRSQVPFDAVEVSDWLLVTYRIFRSFSAEVPADLTPASAQYLMF
jgi:hypothetical protein